MWFEWRGRRSDEMGVVVKQLPPLIVPARRDESHVIPGRNGALHVWCGEYEETQKTVACYVPYEQGVPVACEADVLSWLTGDGWLRLSNRPGRMFKARIVNEQQHTIWVAGFLDTLPSITFECAPEAYWLDETVVSITTSGARVYNPGTAAAPPIITVYGSGSITLTYASTTLAIDDLDAYAKIDAETGDAEHGAVSGIPAWIPANTNCTFTWTGNVTRVQVVVRWRDIP